MHENICQKLHPDKLKMQQKAFGGRPGFARTHWGSLSAPPVGPGEAWPPNAFCYIFSLFGCSFWQIFSCKLSLPPPATSPKKILNEFAIISEPGLETVGGGATAPICPPPRGDANAGVLHCETTPDVQKLSHATLSEDRAVHGQKQNAPK